MSLNFILENNITTKTAPSPWTNLFVNSIETTLPIENTDASSIQGVPVTPDSPTDGDVLTFNQVSSELEYKQPDASSIQGVPVTSDSPTDGDVLTYNQISSELEYKNPGVIGNLTYVNSLSDFPAPVGDTITLEDGINYIITTIIDTGLYKFVTPSTCSLIGVSYNSAGFESNRTGTLIDIRGNCTIQNLCLKGNGSTRTIEVNEPTSYILFDKVDISDAEAGVYVNDCNVFNIAYSRIQNSNSGIYLNGTAITIIISFIQLISCLNCIEGAPEIISRMTINNCLFEMDLGQTGLNISNTLSTIGTESLIINSNIFTGDSVQYLSPTNIDRIDNRTRYTENRGILNSTEFGQLFKPTSTDVTAIGNTTDYYAVVATGSTLDPLSQRFDGADTTLTYKGGINRGFLFQASVSVSPQASSGNNDVLEFGFSKTLDLQNPFGILRVNTDGVGDPVTLSLNAVISLVENESVTLVVRNRTGSNNMIINSYQMTVTTITF